MPAELVCSLRDGAYDFWTVYRLDNIEQGDNVFRFITLQRADQMQLQPLYPAPGCPMFLRFLYPVLAEDAVPTGQCRVYPVVRLTLGNRDQFNWLNRGFVQAGQNGGTLGRYRFSEGSVRHDRDEA